MDYFVSKNLVARNIWSQSDTIFFINASAEAEFFLDKAVDLLHFTGKLPADPVEHLFSKVGYAR